MFSYTVIDKKKAAISRSPKRKREPVVFRPKFINILLTITQPVMELIRLCNWEILGLWSIFGVRSGTELFFSSRNLRLFVKKSI